jgi:hypothetical protein
MLHFLSVLFMRLLAKRFTLCEATRQYACIVSTFVEKSVEFLEKQCMLV